MGVGVAVGRKGGRGIKTTLYVKKITVKHKQVVLKTSVFLAKTSVLSTYVWGKHNPK